MNRAAILDGVAQRNDQDAQRCFRTQNLDP